MLKYDRDHVITLPAKGWVSLWTGNYLKNINPREPHQILILYSILDQIMTIQQNTD